MAYETVTKAAETQHNITMEGRRRLSVSGVGDVESFNEEEVIMSGGSWTMSVRGRGMHMERLSVDSGDVIITGRIDSLSYEDEAPPREGFFKRLLG